MKADFVWTEFPKPINNEGFFPYVASKGKELLEGPAEMTNCLKEESFSSLNSLNLENINIQAGAEQLERLQNCAPDSMINAFFYSDTVVNSSELFHHFWKVLSL